MIQHLLIADLAAILLTLGLTKWILRPATRRIHWLERKAGPFGHPAFGVVAYVGAMWLWHVPLLLRRGARRTPASTCSSTSASPPPGSSTGGTCCRRSARACGSAAWARCSTWPRPRCSSACSASCSRSRPSCSTTATRATGTRLGLSPLDDLHVAGLIMALEQSLVMGIALVYLFVRMLSEADRGGRARRALRGGVALVTEAPPRAHALGVGLVEAPARRAGSRARG